MENQEEHKPRLKPIIEGAETLSLGISMVVAILIGIAIGLGLKKLTGITWQKRPQLLRMARWTISISPQ